MANMVPQRTPRSIDRGSASAAPRSFLFDHIPKTGGTAFRAALEQIFGKQNVSPWISGRSELWAQQTFAEYRVISGHFHSPIPMNVSANGRARLTMLRDPVDRILSEYYYYRNNIGRIEWNKLAVLAKEHDFNGYVEALQATRDTSISNLYARRFASQLSRWLWNDRKIVSLAEEALQRYEFVGIQEQFADSVDMFCCQFKLPTVPDIRPLNVTSSRQGLNDIDSETYARVAELNRLDMKIYESARRRFESQKRRLFRTIAEGTAPDANGIQPVATAGQRHAELPPESFGDLAVEFRDARVSSSVSGAHVLRSGEQAILALTFVAAEDVSDLTVGIEISDELGEIVFGTNTHLMQQSRSVSAGGAYKVEFTFSVNMKHGRYYVGASLHTGATHEERCFHWRDRIAQFDVVDESSSTFVGYCHLRPKVRWSGPA